MTQFSAAVFSCSKMLNKSVLFLLLLGSAGEVLALPHQAGETDVKSCRFLGRVSGDSGYGKNNDWKSLAKYAVLRRLRA